jgi:formamidopyrimidine-DNA glycosylase
VVRQRALCPARIHPLRPIHTLSDAEIEALYRATRETLQQSIDLGGSHWEQNLYGEHGRWDGSYFLAAYRAGAPCPACGAAVVKIKTGSTAGYICPGCQRLETGQ